MHALRTHCSLHGPGGDRRDITDPYSSSYSCIEFSTVFLVNLDTHNVGALKW